MFRSLANIKVLTWVLLFTIIFISLFDKNVTLSNSQIGLSTMVLLLALFSDLKEFDFWGLKGKKSEEKLLALEGEKALPDKKLKIDKEKLDDAEKSPAPIQLMDTSQGNFLALAFEVERLLRIFGTVGLVKDIPNNVNIQTLTRELREKDLLTDIGVQQINAIRWIRNILVHGRQNEINQAALDTGIEIAHGLYRELYHQLYGEFPEL